MAEFVVPPDARRIVTENSIYLLWADADSGAWGYYVRLPLDEHPRGSPSPRLRDNVAHTLTGWCLERDPWAPSVLLLRLWGPGSTLGVVTSPVVAIDGQPTGPFTPEGETRTTLEVFEALAAPGYRPDWVEAHGDIPLAGGEAPS